MSNKRAANTDEPKAPEWPLDVQELSPELTAIVKDLEKKQERAEIAAQLASQKLLAPIYESRREALSSIKNFWGIALGQHPELSTHLQDPEDAKAMTYLKDLWVERDPVEPRAFTLTFTFEENPYFSDTALTKAFKYTVQPGVSTDADEHGVTEAMMDFDWERDIEPTETKISWKDPAKALTTLRPLPDLEKIKADFKDDESLSIEPGSFFHLFEAKEDEYDIGQTIAEELFPEALAYFTGEHENARTNLDDEDWSDDEGEEVD